MEKSPEEAMLNISHNLQEERQRSQEKIFKIWLNSKLAKAPGSPEIKDLFQDLKDGKYLLLLLTVLTDKKLKPVKGNLRLHYLNNITLAFEVLSEYKIKLVGISNQSITDGDKVTTLGLCWSIIYRFQVLEALKNDSLKGSAEKTLLGWCNDVVSEYSGADVKSFQPKRWRDGYTLNAIIHAFKPELFQYSALSKLDDNERIDHALSYAHNNFNITPLFAAKDFENDVVDSRTLVMYISFLYEQLQTMVPASKRSSVDELNKVVATMKEIEDFIKEKDESTLGSLSNSTLREVCKKYFEFKESSQDFSDMDAKISVTDKELQTMLDVPSNDKPEIVEAKKGYENAKEIYYMLKNRWVPFEDQIHSKLLELLAEELDQINELLAKYEVDEVKIQSFLDEVGGNTSVKDLSTYMAVNEDILSNLNQMQPLMGFIKDLVEQINQDDTISDVNRKNFTERAIKTKSRYDALLRALKNKKKKLLVREEELRQKEEEERRRQNESDKQREQAFQEWHKELKDMTDWLSKKEQKLDTYEIQPMDIQNLESQIGDYEEMRDEMKNYAPQKDALLVKGNDIITNQKDLNDRNDMQSKVTLVDDKWNSLDRRLGDNIERLQQKKEEERRAKEEEDKARQLDFQEWHNELKDLTNWLSKEEKNFDEFEIQPVDVGELESQISDYEIMRNGLKNREPKRDALLAKGNDIIANQKDLSDGNDLRSEITLVDDKWNSLEQKLGSGINRLRQRKEEEKQKEIARKKEKEAQLAVFQNWHKKLTDMITWLLNVEQKVAGYEKKSIDPQKLKSMMNDYQKMRDEMKSGEPEKDALLAKGNEIIVNEKDLSDGNDLQMEVTLVDDKWSSLERRLNVGFERLKEKEEEERQKEIARNKEREAQLISFQEWHKDVTDMINWLLKTEQSVARYENLPRDQQSLKSLIANYQNTKKELSKRELKKNKLVSKGRNILEGQKELNEGNNVEMEITLVEEQWNILQQRIDGGLDRSTEQLRKQMKDSVDGMDHILQNVATFRDWIELANQQLQATNSSTNNINFEDLHQREQGLKKLSSDLESRSAEIETFLKMAEDMKTSTNDVDDDDIVKEKKAAVLQNVGEMNKEWSDIIDKVDAEFKNLYDLINCNLDENRTQIEHSLKLMKENLSKMENNDFDKQVMLTDCKKLSELSKELSKLKPPIKKLSQNVVSLGEMTVFAEDEQQLLCESSDALQADFELSTKQIQDTKTRSKEKILNYFKEEAEKSKAKVAELAENSPSFSTEEKDLSVLRDYLTIEQKLSGELKSEHFKLDDLEQYAEEVSAFELLAADDQVAIANIINDALKNVEELRSETKLNFNSAYAVTMHMIKQQLRANGEKLKKSKGKSEKIEFADLKHFNDVCNVLQKIKNDKDVLNMTSSELIALNEEICLMNEAGLMESADNQALKELTSTMLQDTTDISENISLQEIRTKEEINGFVLRKLDEFRGWLPTVQKRSSESNEIGPDPATIKKQLHELQVIEQQAHEKSGGVLTAKETAGVYDMMPKTSQAEIAAGKQEWKLVDDWIQERKKALEHAQDLWDEYRRDEADLSQYMRDNKKLMETWNQLDLNDHQSIDEHEKALNNIKESMEIRKSHVGKLTDISDQLLDMLDADNPVSYNLLSEVADIHESWNSVLKQSIESGTKLKKAQHKLKTLEDNIKQVQQWVAEGDDVLKEFQDDNIDEKTEPYLPAVQDKLKNVEEMRNLLISANISYQDLSEDNDTKSHFTVDDMPMLNKEFARVEGRLQKIKTLGDKSPYLRWFYKRVLYGK